MSRSERWRTTDLTLRSQLFTSWEMPPLWLEFKLPQYRGLHFKRDATSSFSAYPKSEAKCKKLFIKGHGPISIGICWGLERMERGDPDQEPWPQANSVRTDQKAPLSGKRILKNFHFQNIPSLYGEDFFDILGGNQLHFILGVTFDRREDNPPF